MIDEEKVESLRRRAQRQGPITTNVLREILPIEEMSADELALAVLQLEEAGVMIEIDEALMGSSRRRTTTSPETAVINLPGARGGIRDVESMRVSTPDLSADAFSPTEPVERATPEYAGAWKYVAAAALLIAIGALAAFFLSR
jgi:hypothetical protein